MKIKLPPTKTGFARELELFFEHPYILSDEPEWYISNTSKSCAEVEYVHVIRGRGTDVKLRICEGFPDRESNNYIEKEWKASVSCHKNDTFKKETGRKAALRRLFEENVEEFSYLFDRYDRSLIWQAALPKRSLYVRIDSNIKLKVEKI